MTLSWTTLSWMIWSKSLRANSLLFLFFIRDHNDLQSFTAKAYEISRVWVTSIEWQTPRLEQSSRTEAFHLVYTFLSSCN
jgi:hypothetical protein